MDENNSILGFPELKVNGSYDCEIDGVLFHVYEVQNRKHNDRCPVCGGRGKIHESVIRRIRDLDSFGMPIYLFYKVNKYDCLNCNCFFAEDISAVADDKARMTNRMREAVARRAVNYSFESVAADYNISSTTVKRAFKDWVDSKDDARSEFLYTPEVLGIDETHIGNKMSAVFTDNKNNRLLEILPGRKKPEVIEFLKSLQEPNTLKAVTTDMWKGYREAVREVFGERVPVVIDHLC